MILASRVTNPSRSGLAPSPTQQLMEDSVTLTPASTASRAEPFRLSTSQAPLLAASPVSQVEMTTGCPSTRPSSASSPEAVFDRPCASTVGPGPAAPAFFVSNNPNDPNRDECKKERRLDMINSIFLRR